MKRIVVATIVALSLLLSSVSIYAASFEDGAGKEEIPYGEELEGVTCLHVPCCIYGVKCQCIRSTGDLL